MPNLETKIVCADSLKSLSADVFEEELKEKMILEREKYYQPDVSSDERKEIAGRIADMMDVVYPTFAIRLGLKQVSNKAVLKKWFMTGSVNAPFFDMKTFFPEIDGGFDIVIGNPPYGGFKIADEVKDSLGLGNKDPYGAFIARFLGNGSRITPLKNGGMLSFIVSDTFMTIGTHLKLRQQMMHNRIYKMVRMSPKTFSATVNTVVIVCEKCRADNNDSAVEGNICQMADMSNIDIHEDYEHFMDILSRSTMQMTNVANEEYAIYNYEQKLIKNCSNMPFFVASPKLFSIMVDMPLSNRTKSVKGRNIVFRNVCINGLTYPVIKLGDEYDKVKKKKVWKNVGLARVISGIKTGGNNKYLVSINGKKYPKVSDPSLIISFDESLKLTEYQIQNGIKVPKCYLPYDMGQASDADGGWLPNYYQEPTVFYVNWSTASVTAMKNEAHSDLANWEFRCKEGIVFSKAGVYAPTFRLTTGSIIDSGSNGIFCDEIDVMHLLGILCSKLVRYLLNTFINHTVNSQVDDIKVLPIVLSDSLSIAEKVSSIIKQQKENLYYDYASHEQIEIDKLVYKAYGLNDEDIKEVETWFARRYPKLAAAQRSNLEKLMKA